MTELNAKPIGVVRDTGMVAFHGTNFRKLVPAGSAGAYAFAAFCVAVAALVRWTIGLFVEGVVPFATFFPAALFAALVGGIGPGIFARAEYVLTAKGRDLGPIVRAMRDWGRKYAR